MLAFTWVPSLYFGFCWSTPYLKLQFNEKVLCGMILSFVYPLCSIYIIIYYFCYDLYILYILYK